MLHLVPMLALCVLTNFLLFSMPCNFFLISRHKIQGKNNCSKCAFSNVVVRCAGRGMFYRFMIRTQFVGSLCLETVSFTGVSQFFLTLLGHMRWPE